MSLLDIDTTVLTTWAYAERQSRFPALDLNSAEFEVELLGGNGARSGLGELSGRLDVEGELYAVRIRENPLLLASYSYLCSITCCWSVE